MYRREDFERLAAEGARRFYDILARSDGLIEEYVLQVTTKSRDGGLLVYETSKIVKRYDEEARRQAREQLERIAEEMGAIPGRIEYVAAGGEAEQPA